MKKLIGPLSLLILLLSGCSFDVHVMTPAPVASPLPSLTSIGFPSPAPVSVSTEMPVTGFTPEPGQALFYGARAVLDPNDPQGRSAFPAGTQRIYVVWNYQDMREGLTIKREWYLDGELWLKREEPWDYAKYGTFGTMQDVSIYDLNVGLPAGVYQLKIYIDGLLQPIGSPTSNGAELWLKFEVLPSGSITEAASPDFKWTAAVLNGNRFIVRDANGTPFELFVGSEIPLFQWFPDNRHILFIDRDRTEQVPGTSRGVRDRLWAADVVRREVVQLYESDTMLGSVHLSISPYGNFIAASEGTRGGDACFVDLKMKFFELASDYQSIRVIGQEKFSGIPSAPDSSFYPTAAGSWQGNTQFMVPMGVTCVIGEEQPRDYVFDLANLTAVRK